MARIGLVQGRLTSRKGLFTLMLASSSSRTVRLAAAILHIHNFNRLVKSCLISTT